jgi:hypothetical protein
MPVLYAVLDTLFGDPTIARDALYAPTGGEAVSVRVVVRRPDAIVGFGETRIHAETTVFDVRTAEVTDPRPGDRLTLDGVAYVIQGAPERRDPDRLIWTLDGRPS